MALFGEIPEMSDVNIHNILKLSTDGTLAKKVGLQYN